MKPWLLLVWAVLVPLASAQQEVNFRAADGVRVFGSYYPAASKQRPLILLFHMSGSNRWEYEAIAPELVRMGFNCLAIDQRSGGTMWNRTNRTRDGLGRPAAFAEALPDLEAALRWAKATGHRGKLLLWGSSYSAALVFVLAARHPEVSAVLAFSPGEYLAPAFSVREAAARVQVPVFITSARFEGPTVRGILAAVASRDKTQFVPRDTGMHGSLALSFPPYRAEYWPAVARFLRRFT
ncbi:alpha/beta hydrolase [Calidithermus chliarophilus]|uniref:alpha/beta hydrolase n=1 Tax=Calidithermus chliarophilus TaxID=52023 RepID=UPI00042477C1|nr:alpha/beta fold hydrolase [Calidithermus chliarophilus]